MAADTNNWSATLPQVSKVEFQLSGALYIVLETNENRDKSGHRIGFLNEATEHAASRLPLRTLPLFYCFP